MAQNTQVKQLIAENLRTQNPYLDLGRCGLDGDKGNGIGDIATAQRRTDI